MSNDDRPDLEFCDAARAISAKLRVDNAIRDLAAAPLAEDTAEQMREVLADPALASAREALRRLAATPYGRAATAPQPLTLISREEER